jgi:hypothetical protein
MTSKTLHYSLHKCDGGADYPPSPPPKEWFARFVWSNSLSSIGLLSITRPPPRHMLPRLVVGVSSISVGKYDIWSCNAERLPYFLYYTKDYLFNQLQNSARRRFSPHGQCIAPCACQLELPIRRARAVAAYKWPLVVDFQLKMNAKRRPSLSFPPAPRRFASPPFLT